MNDVTVKSRSFSQSLVSTGIKGGFGVPGMKEQTKGQTSDTTKRPDTPMLLAHGWRLPIH
jgi:hypothetical protein